MFDFTGWGSIPGIDDIRENTEAAITWGPWEYNRAFIVPTLLDGAARDAGNSPTTVLRAGLMLGVNRSSGKASEWDPAATDGTQDFAGILLWDSISQQLGSDKDRWFGFMLVGGLVKSSAVLVPGAASAGIDGSTSEYLVRGLMSGRYLLDDPYHYGSSGNPNFGGWKNIVNITANKTLVEADNNTLFTNLGATGAITLTLPAITNSKGQRYGFFNCVNQNIAFAAAAAGDLIGFNNAAADTATLGTAGNKIGGQLEALGIGPVGASGQWAITSKGPHTVTMA